MRHDQQLSYRSICSIYRCVQPDLLLPCLTSMVRYLRNLAASPSADKPSGSYEHISIHECQLLVVHNRAPVFLIKEKKAVAYYTHPVSEGRCDTGLLRKLCREVMHAPVRRVSVNERRKRVSNLHVPSLIRLHVSTSRSVHGVTGWHSPPSSGPSHGSRMTEGRVPERRRRSAGRTAVTLLASFQKGRVVHPWQRQEYSTRSAR
jgi:hypothetical protein